MTCPPPSDPWSSHTRRAWLAGALATAAVGCGPPAVQREAPGVHALEDKIHGKWRRSKLIVPPGLTGTVPMVIGLHDTGQAPADLYGPCGWQALCARRGWVGVFPTYQKDNQTEDNAYLGFLLLRAAALGGVDRGRVYVFGHGAGGRRAYALACENAKLITAIGASSAVVRFVEDDLDFQDPDGPPMPVFHVHGGADERVRVSGGPLACGDRRTRSVVPLDEALQPWIAGVGGQPATPTIEAPAGVQAARWAGGAYAVERWVVPGHDHTWSPHTTEAMAAFFDAAPSRPIFY